MRKITRSKTPETRKRRIKRRLKPYWATDTGKVYHGECSQVLPLLKNKIDLVVTSPPYDKMRKYKGYSFDFKAIAKPLVNAVKKGGVIVWVVGDQTNEFSESGNSFRQALHFMDLGMKLYDTMIYRKASALPMNTDRYTQEFEYMFIFSKGKVKTFNPIRVQSRHYKKDKIWDYSKRKSASAKDGGAMPTGTARFQANKYKKKGNIWTYMAGGGHGSKDKIASEHSAVFPEKLVKDHIISWSNPGDIVLDPMSGSGTTVKVAQVLGRRWIAIDGSKVYCRNIKKRFLTYHKK